MKQHSRVLPSTALPEWDSSVSCKGERCRDEVTVGQLTLEQVLVLSPLTQHLFLACLQYGAAVRTWADAFA